MMMPDIGEGLVGCCSTVGKCHQVDRDYENDKPREGTQGRASVLAQQSEDEHAHWLGGLNRREVSYGRQLGAGSKITEKLEGRGGNALAPV
jgi:hypothetical protein